MPIARDLSDLPAPAKTREDGCPPDAEPRFVHLLAEHWAAENAERDANYKRRTRFHLSDAGKCARAIAYAALEVPSSNPMDLTGIHNTRIGTEIHNAWQAVVRAKYPEAQVEPRHVILDGDGSGYSDLVLTLDKVIAFELKSIGGFGYKLAVGERGAAQGPKFEHLVQGALNAQAADADELVIGYLSKEAISVNVAQRKGFTELQRFCAEWTFTREQYEPIAEAELNRVARILAMLDEGTLPARKIPGGELPPGAVITDPSTGQWRVHDGAGGIVDAGTFWMCSYCRWQDSCAQTSTGRQAVSEVAVVLGIGERAA